MAEHEPCIGETSEWFTPPEIFDALKLTFDLDPCSSGPGHWIPAREIYAKDDDGLMQPWEGAHVHEPAIRQTDQTRALAAQILRTEWHRDRAALPHRVRGGTRRWTRPSSSCCRRLRRSSCDGTARSVSALGMIVLIGAVAVACEALLRSKLGMVWDRAMSLPPG